MAGNWYLSYRMKARARRMAPKCIGILSVHSMETGARPPLPARQPEMGRTKPANRNHSHSERREKRRFLFGSGSETCLLGHDNYHSRLRGGVVILNMKTPEPECRL